MGAAGEQRNQNHQIGQRKQPLVRLCACGFCRACKKSQVTPAREIVQMLDADSVRLAISDSVKIFWLDFTVTT